MSEFEDIEDFEEFDLEDEFGEYELEEEDDAAARVAAASAEVARWEEETGVRLSDSDFNHVATQVDLYGLTPEAAYGDSEPGRFEAKFEATVEAVEREQGRKLLDSEVDDLWKVAERAADDPAVETDAQVWTATKDSASNMLDTQEGRAEYICQRLSVPQERTEASAVTEDDRPSYNVDDPSERAAAIDAAMSGETASIHGDDDLED